MVAKYGNHFTLRNVCVHPAKTTLVIYYISIWPILSVLQPVVKLCHLAFTAVPPGLQRDPILRPSPPHQISTVIYHLYLWLYSPLLVLAAFQFLNPIHSR
jgi:hypothetical protein